MVMVRFRHMKQMSTTPVSTTARGLRIRKSFSKYLLITTAFLIAAAVPMQLSRTNAYADEFDARIAAIQEQRDIYDAKAAQLAQEADSLSNKKAILENQKAALQEQINLSQAKYDKLKRDIAANEQKISDNKDALGKTIADMYVQDSVTPLELLASSSSIGDYVDQQEFRATIRDNLSLTIDQIEKLRVELEAQKTEVTQLLADQKAQRSQLAQKVAEYANLVAETQNKQSAYRQLSAKAAEEQSELRAQQQAAIAAALAVAGGGSAVAGDPNHGGYPNNLANAPQDSIVDPWGMFNRECVSYTAWKVYQKNGYMPYWGGVGNANQWPANARAAGIPTGSTPRVGSVGVIYAGPYGHVVWVDSINADGTINISQYNYNYGSGPGMYSEQYNLSPSAFSVYIYF